MKLSRALERIEALCSDPGQVLKPDNQNDRFAKQEKDDALVIKSTKGNKYPASSGNKPETSAETDGSNITEQLPAAAAVKFLVDAPEAMYRFLSARAYLQAAFLWLLARTVKEYMLSSQEDSAEEEHNKVRRRRTRMSKLRTLIYCLPKDVHAAGTETMGNACSAESASRA